MNATNLNKLQDNVEEEFNNINTNVTNTENSIGDLSNLNTTEKSNLVGAINEANEKTTYSTEEQVIGTWIDGKPLYIKTFNFTDSVSLANKIQKSHNISNVDTIFIDTSHSFITSKADGTLPLPSVGYFGNFNDRLEVNVDKTYIRIHSDTTWDTSWTKVVTLLYTKTTD